MCACRCRYTGTRSACWSCGTWDLHCLPSVACCCTLTCTVCLLPDVVSECLCAALAYTIAYRPCAPRLLTLWARAGRVYAYMYVCARAHMCVSADVRAHAMHMHMHMHTSVHARTHARLRAEQGMRARGDSVAITWHVTARAVCAEGMRQQRACYSLSSLSFLSQGASHHTDRGAVSNREHAREGRTNNRDGGQRRGKD